MKPPIRLKGINMTKFLDIKLRTFHMRGLLFLQDLIIIQFYNVLKKVK